MAKKIQSSDIFAGDLTSKQIKEFEALIKVLEKLEQQQKENLKVSAEGLKVNAKEYEDVKKNLKLIQDQEKAEQTLLKTEQQREKLQQERIKTINQGLTQQQKELALADKQAKANARQTREQLKLTGAYDKQSKRLNQLRKQYKNLIVEQGKETKATKKMRQEIQKLDKQLKSVDASAGQFQRSVGNYGKAFSGLKSLGSAVLPVAGITGLVTVMGNAVKIFRDFEKANSNLRAVSGATDSEMSMMSETAKKLGASTQFTATQVTGLQVEFAKLGFTTNQIQDMTEATLDLASASGVDLSEASMVAGATMGAFGLKAKETQRVVDVMAKSFSTTALDMEKFKESMKLVAPVSKAVGVSIEETTAMLGTLANAGISGSMAGTSLRGIFTQLAKKGLTLSQAYEKVSRSSNKLATATDLVGKNAGSSFLVLAEGTETTKELDIALQGATGSAKEMAEIQLDNLAGDVTKLSSAWEGFILGLEDGEGVLSNFFRKAIQFTSDLLSKLTLLTKSMSQLVGEVLNDTKEYSDLLEGLSGDDLDYWANQNNSLNEYIDDLKKAGKEFDNLSEKEQLRIKKQIAQNEFAKERIEDLTDAIEKQKKTRDKIFGGEEGLKDFFNNYESEGFVDRNKLLRTEEFKRFSYQLAPGLSQEQQAEEFEKFYVKLYGDITKKTAELGFYQGSIDSLVKDEVKQAVNKSGGKTLDQKKKGMDFLLSKESRLGVEETGGLDEGVNNDLYEALCNRAGGEWDRSTQSCSLDIDFEAEEKNIIDYQEVLTEVVDKYTTERINLIDKELDANQKRQEVLQQLASQGIQDAKENLAEEKKQQAELERERERALKRQQRIELGLAVLNSYSNNVENDVNNPLAKTITDTSVLLSFIQSLPTFYEGTENTGTGGQLDNKGGFHAILHPNERVMTAEQNRDLNGLSNWELSNLGKSYKEGNLTPQIKLDNTEIVSKLDEIVNKPTYLGRDYDATEKAIIETVIKKGRIERNHRKTGKNLF